MAYAMAARQPGGAGMIEERTFEPPSPGAGQVLLEQKAIGVNFIDVYFRKGLYPWGEQQELILDSEGAGIVRAIGDGVDTVATGDRVAYTLPNGAYASHRLIEARYLVPIPATISDNVAAGAMLKGLTAHYLLHRSYPVGAGETVLFQAAGGGGGGGGGGGVGMIAGQWLAAKGVTAIGTAGGADKCAQALTHGYAHGIDYQTQDFVDEVGRLTDGNGVYAAYDSIGADTLKGSLSTLRTFGFLVSFGQSSGPPPPIELAELAKGSYSVTRPSLFHFSEDRQWLLSAANDLFTRIEQGDIAIPVDQTLSLREAAKAHQMLESRQTTGCTILLPWCSH